MTTLPHAELSARAEPPARATAATNTRKQVAAMLALALVLGGWMRFAHLGAREMSADEGATWAAATAPNLEAVVKEQAILNPGKLAFEEIALHAWVEIFGEGLRAMRALSSAFDTLSILIVFLLTRELFGAPGRAPRERAAGAIQHPLLILGELAREDADLVAAIAALLFAVNLVSIKYAQEIRMYALAQLLVLAQVWFFVRAARRGGIFNLIAIAAFTALALGAHFTTAFMVAAEGGYLLLLAYAGSQDFAWSRGETEFRQSEGQGDRLISRWIRLQTPLAVALAAGVAIFVVVAAPALRTGASAFAHGATSWIERPPWWEPIALFNKGTGSFAFPVMVALAGWGVWRGWAGDARGAVSFALAWMWLPPILLLFASYALAPMFVERYVLWCFVPFFVLAALGVRELPTTAFSAAALAFAVALALGHVHGYRQRQHGVQWREAARAAAGNLSPGAKIAVGPPYAVNVVRYYLRGTRAAGAAVPAESAGAEFLIADERWIAQGKAAKLLPNYLRPVARVRGIRVLRGDSGVR